MCAYDRGPHDLGTLQCTTPGEHSDNPGGHVYSSSTGSEVRGRHGEERGDE